MRKLVPVVLLAAAFAWAEDNEEGPEPVTDEEAKSALEQFNEAYKADELEARAKACLALGKVYHATTQRTLLNVLVKDKESKVRGAAALALGQHGDVEAVPSICSAMDACREMPEAMEGICIALGQLGDKRAIKPLASDLWKTKTPAVIYCRIGALGKIRDKQAIEELLDLFYVASAQAVAPYAPAIGKALHELTDQGFGSDREGWKDWWRKNKATFKFPDESEDDPKKPRRPRRER